jgi:hypothetical protein
MFPTPFTADQIRDATQPGRTYCYRVEEDGKPTTVRIMTFESVSSEGAELRIKVESETGKALSEPPPKRVLWEDLRRHAQFPRARVTLREEKVTVPAGTFECKVYVVKGEEDLVTTFYFAHKLPGAPVLHYTEKAGERRETHTLVEFKARS